jgi:hypothetical protein
MAVAMHDSMAILLYDTDADTDIDRALTRATRQVLETAVAASPTIAQLAERLGVGYRRTRALLDAFELRGRYRSWQRKEQ